MQAQQTSIQDRILRELQEIKDRLSHFTNALSGTRQSSDTGSDLPGVLDALATHVALLDGEGIIRHTNHSWRRFGEENGIDEEFQWVGINYIQVCQSTSGEDAATGLEVAAGIQRVIDGTSSEFVMEYPCDSPNEKRWFNMRVARTSGDRNSMVVVAHDNITSLKSSYERIRRQQEELRVKADQLTEANTALKVVLQRVEAEKLEVQEKIAVNIQESVLPYLQKIKTTTTESSAKRYLELLEASLLDIRSSFTRTLTSRSAGLTPSEIRIATLIRNGLTTKEIASMLNLSVRGIEFHRRNIRRKLGLDGKRINLHAFLLEMPSVELTYNHDSPD